MTPRRVHILGASGTGTSTLGRALATTWSVPHADTDDYFWVPTTPAYTTKREPADRLRLMREVFVGRDAWVLSGCLTWILWRSWRARFADRRIRPGPLPALLCAAGELLSSRRPRL